MDILLAIILIFVAALVGIAAGYFGYGFIESRKTNAAKQQANKILEAAYVDAKGIRKEALLEAKEEVLKLRAEFDREVKERKAELQRTEQRIAAKEDSIDKKEEQINKKEDTLDRKLELLEESKRQLERRDQELAEREQEIASVHQTVLREIEKVALMTREEARQQLLLAIEDDAKREAVRTVRQIEAEAREDANKRSREIIALAIQRCAVDHSAEITVSVVQLPSDEMKGRIIGREGRNIRALESATGVDLIIDDTPDTVVLSCFDPVRREVARIALEKLLSDGRIHPSRIEDVVEKVRKEIDQTIKEAGEAAMFEAGVYGLHPDLVKLLGRLRYRTSYGQNVLKHSLEVSHLAGLLAAELGADVNLAKRGGLLHDIGKALDHEVEGTHITIGADIARKYKENPSVVHCIAAHHNDIEPESIEAILVQTADAISGARPGARRESLDNYVKRLEKLEGIANAFRGVEKSFAVQAGREIRIIVKPEVVDDAASVFMAREIARQIESEMEYPGQIKVHVIRELRTVEYAK